MEKTLGKNRFWLILAITTFVLGLVGGLTHMASAKVKRSASGVTCQVEADRKVLADSGPQNVIIKVTLDAPQPPEKSDRPPVNLAIVLDRSGSMTGRKIEKAKEAAIEALRRLGPRDIFSLIVYDHNVQTIVPAQYASNIEWIESRIRGIRPGGNTALFGGVSQGAAEIRKHITGNYVHRVILLSDGIANVGPCTPDDLGRLGAALIKEGISVSTVGVGTDYNEDLMARLSQNSDGNTYFVESSLDLPRIFSAELGNVLNVVASKVHVIIECPDGVRPLKIIGRDGRIRDRKVEMFLNQLYGGQQKFALVEVEVPAGKSGDSIEIARAQVLYENPFTQKNESAAGIAKAKFSSDMAKVRKSTNIEVKRDYLLNLNALAQEEAIEHADRGQPATAVNVLKKSVSRLKTMGMELKDEVLLEKAEEMDEQAVIIEREGMSKRSRKQLRTDSYQMKNQQQAQ